MIIAFSLGENACLMEITFMKFYFQEHLACFYPGTLALAHMAGAGGEDLLNQATELTHTCYQMYNFTTTGLSPEIASMNTSPDVKEDIYSGVGIFFKCCVFNSLISIDVLSYLLIWGIDLI